MRAVAAVALAALLAAGCLGGNDPATGGDPATPGPSGEASGGSLGANTSAAAPVAAPQWSVGQSWTWRLTSAAVDGPAEATTVVLAAQGGSYDVGATSTQEIAALYPFHLVGVGAVDAATLAWQAHGLPVTLLRFPLVDGATFTADLWGAAGAVVMLAAQQVAGPDGPEPGFRATAAYADGGTFLAADYAPARGQFVRVASYFRADEPFAEAVLVREGAGGEATPFRVTDLARFPMSAGDPASLAPRPFTMPAGSDLAMLACFLSGAQGYYSAQMEVAGVPMACAGGGAGATKLAWAYTAVLAPNGSVSAAAAGPGTSTIEAFAIDTTAA